jgi:hypothetical protein
MFLTIQKLEHYIRTIFGDSETYFGGDKDVDLYAVPMSTTGQGNGAGPQIWALVSTPILNMLRAEDLGMAFRCTLSGEKVGFVGYSFVDDTDLGICGDHANYLEVVEDMQRSMNYWEGGLRATGGAIAPEKTFWYLIDYKWTNGVPSYKSALECPAEISVKDMYGAVQTIRRCPVDHAERTLGIYLAPDGNERVQELVLRKKSVEWAKALRSSTLPRSLAIQAYSTTIARTFAYPTVATCLTRKQTASVQGPAMIAALRAAGVGSDAPVVLRTGPVEFQGLGMPDLYTTQLYAHLDALVFALEQPHRNTSQLIRVNGELLKLELGLNGRLFDYDYSLFQESVTKSWMKSTWQMCSESKVSISDTYPEFVPRRQGDVLIMEGMAALRLPSATMTIVNRCRMYLWVVYLADIVSGNGTSITDSAWKGKRDNTRNTPYDWPEQGTLSESCWAIWRDVLQKQWCAPTRRLRNTLGHWYESDPTT